MEKINNLQEFFEQFYNGEVNDGFEILLTKEQRLHFNKLFFSQVINFQSIGKDGSETYEPTEDDYNCTDETVLYLPLGKKVKLITKEDVE